MIDSELSVTTPASVEAMGERIREAERKRIAKDLHDELGSQLAAIKIALAQLTQQLPEHNQRLQNQAQHTDQLLDGAFEIMHGIIDDLHPAILDLGLTSALEWLVQTYDRQNGVTYQLTRCDAAVADVLDAFQSVSLYRIVREALHNASRHARASKVSVQFYQDQSNIVLEVVDNGIGLDADRSKDAHSSGIRSMRQRAAAIGASFKILSADSGGVHIQVRMPVHAEIKLIK